MEAGYSSETNRVDGMFNQGPFAGSPSGYFYNSPPPLKGALKSETACFTETSSEDSLAKKLNSLTNSLNQGKPINVEDIMSLRTSNEVGLLHLISGVVVGEFQGKCQKYAIFLFLWWRKLA